MLAQKGLCSCSLSKRSSRLYKTLGWQAFPEEVMAECYGANAKLWKGFQKGSAKSLPKQESETAQTTGINNQQFMLIHWSLFTHHSAGKWISYPIVFDAEKISDKHGSKGAGQAATTRDIRTGGKDKCACLCVGFWYDHMKHHIDSKNRIHIGSRQMKATQSFFYNPFPAYATGSSKLCFPKTVPPNLWHPPFVWVS